MKAAILAITAAMAGQAHAQGASAARPGPPVATKADAAKTEGSTVESVTVTGQSQNGFRSAIDRRSYGVANDLQGTAGSIADALRNVPAVAVDPQGNVSLRGDPNVTIMIDGKASGLFKGPNAGLALQSLPANQIARVEVITNPSAEFSAEGSAGIINLITKTTGKPGLGGSARVNVGGGGRRNGGVAGSYKTRALTLTTDLSARRDAQNGRGEGARQLLDGQGGVLSQSRSRVVQRGHGAQVSGRGGMDYEFDPKTRLSAEARYAHIGFHATQDEPVTSVDPAGAVTATLNQLFQNRLTRDTVSEQATLRHSFAEGHDLVVNASHERTTEDRDTAVQQSIGGTPSQFLALRARGKLELSQIKGDYARPLGHSAKLKAGIDYRVDDNHYRDAGGRGLTEGDAGPDPRQSERFNYRQGVTGGYVTYERPVGDWTVLAGLRLEQADLRLEQITTEFRRDADDFRLFPSLHLTDRLTETQQLSFSYAKRIQRPSPQDLDPFLSQIDPRNLRQGNPVLAPQITHTLEAGFQYRNGRTFYLATAYYRRNENGVTDVVSRISDDVLLTTRANLDGSRSAGLELVANGPVLGDLTYNLSGNLYWSQIDAGPLSSVLNVSGRRSDVAVGGRGSLNWQISRKDMLQVTAQLNPRRLIPQGYTRSFFVSHLGYRHNFTPDLAAVVTVYDVFGTMRFGQTLKTPLVREVRGGEPGFQAILLGLTWNFGGPASAPRPQGFDFGGGPPT